DWSSDVCSSDLTAYHFRFSGWRSTALWGEVRQRYSGRSPYCSSARRRKSARPKGVSFFALLPMGIPPRYTFLQYRGGRRRNQEGGGMGEPGKPLTGVS